MWTKRGGKKYYSIPGNSGGQEEFMYNNCDKCVSYNICHACSGVCAGELTENHFNYIGRTEDEWFENNTFCQHLKTQRDIRKLQQDKSTIDIFESNQ